MNEDSHDQTVYEAATSRTLLLRVREASDQEAWEEFVNRYAPQIYQWCRRCHLQDSDAADVSQEVLVKLVRAMRAFEYSPTKGSFRGWLKTVTSNAIRDTAKSFQRAPRGSGDTDLHVVLANIQDEGAVVALAEEFERCHRQELLAAAERMVQDRVQPHTWEAYCLTTTRGRSATEAATDLGMPVSEVYVAKSRVLKMLRETVQNMMASGET